MNKSARRDAEGVRASVIYKGAGCVEVLRGEGDSEGGYEGREQRPVLEKCLGWEVN